MNEFPDGLLRLPIAHRALHDAQNGRPENSRAAVRAAVDKGYAIEIDVQMSADGKAIVFHDYMRDRLTSERGALRLRTAEELGQTRLNGSTETIPSLGEILDIVAGCVPLLIEIKDQDGALGPDVDALEMAISQDLTSYRGDVAVMSFNPHSVAAMGKFAPSIPRGLTTGSFREPGMMLISEKVRENLRGIPDFEAVGACFISHQAVDLPNDRVRQLRAQGVPVLCWTVQSAQAEAAARKYADNVTFEGYHAAIPPE